MGKELNKIDRLAIFDLDGTLIDTPMPAIGRKEYEEKTGKKWPHKGWWSIAQSLDFNMFEMPVIPETIAAYIKEKDAPNTLMVMMTGRLKKLSPEVEKLLEHYDLTFDTYLYNTGGETLKVKLNYLEGLISKCPKIETIHMFEDRELHIAEFKVWGASKDIAFDITEIKSGRHD